MIIKVKVCRHCGTTRNDFEGLGKCHFCNTPFSEAEVHFPDLTESEKASAECYLAEHRKVSCEVGDSRIITAATGSSYDKYGQGAQEIKDVL